ncbi:hypothetical protein F4677DRAFT_249025 [Hypoxylon crocopeplum]|nr:hypothetical protein F4677DRAFT_249025 [Hypoxylon crocopeplum]
MDFPKKRPSPSDSEHEHGQSKRQRTEEPESSSVTPDMPKEKLPYQIVNKPTADDLGREGLKRSIAVALKYVGFDSARKDAMESFTEVVDTYTTQFIDQLRRVANAARRNNPVPEDFELILRRHDITIDSLKPHLKLPIPKEELTPSFYDPIIEDISYLQKPRPYLGEELSGKREKEARPWIPKDFPPFPGPHTYKFTPMEQAKDTNTEQAQAETDVRKGEQALRRINRAARISQQKELKTIADREQHSKQRHQAWEGIMTELIPPSGSSSGASSVTLNGPSTAPEIADNSTIVNFGAKYGRKGVPKNSRRTQTDPFNGMLG